MAKSDNITSTLRGVKQTIYIPRSLSVSREMTRFVMTKVMSKHRRIVTSPS